MLDNRNLIKEEAVQQSLQLQGLKYKVFQLMGKIDRRVRKQMRKSRARQAKQAQDNPLAMTGQQESPLQNEPLAAQNGGAADFLQSGQQPGMSVKLAEATIGSPSDI